MSKKYEQGHTNPLTTLAILFIMGIIAYIAIDTYLALKSANPDMPAELGISDIFTTWVGWSWWTKGLSIISPIILLMIGSKLDNASGFGSLPSDEDVQRIIHETKQNSPKEKE